MSMTSPLSAADSVSAAGQTNSILPGTTLGKDDFLKLLVQELQNQDPLNPTDDKQFLSEMAQFSTLEQMTNVGDALGRLTFQTQVAQATSLLGKTIGYKLADGKTGEGAVTSVTFADGGIHIWVGDTDVAPNEVEKILPGAGA